MDSSLGERLKKLRNLRKMTQSEVGTRIKKPKASINAYEHDISQPPVDVIARLAVLYNVTSDYLLNNDNRETIVLKDLTAEQEKLLSKINVLLIELFKSNRGGDAM